MSLLEKIEYHQRKKHCVNLEREKDSFKGSSCGFILDFSQDFVLLQTVDEFRVEGYQVIPTYTISRVRFDRSDKFRDKILGWEKQKENVGIANKIDLASWSSVFKSIKKTGCFVTVEGEALIRDDISYVTLGQIKRIEKKEIVIQFISGYGYLIEPFDRIAYDDITLVDFNSRYLDMYKKYLQVKK